MTVPGRTGLQVDPGHPPAGDPPPSGESSADVDVDVDVDVDARAGDGRAGDGRAGDGREAEGRLQRALEVSYAYLSRRERTVSELRAQLARKGIAPAVIAAAVTELVEQGVLDDARFARLFVGDKRHLEGWGADRIRRGLQARGIGRDEAEAALAEPLPDEDGGLESELDRALTVLRRRFPTAPQDRRDRERALGMLLRKGYDSELALDALTAHARGD